MPVTIDHLPFLHELLTSGDIGIRFRFRGHTPSPREFVQMLNEGVFIQFIAEDRAFGTPTALARAVRADLRARHVTVSIVSAPRYRGSGVALESGGLLLDYLFGTWRFRKAYAEAAAFNLEQFRSGLGRYFRVEARMPHHQYFAGQTWDTFVLSLSREQWEEFGTGALTEATPDTRGDHEDATVDAVRAELHAVLADVWTALRGDDAESEVNPFDELDVEADSLEVTACRITVEDHFGCTIDVHAPDLEWGGYTRRRMLADLERAVVGPLARRRR